MREMKDSGIEWIGNIPNGWHIEKGKYCFTSKKEIPGIYSGKYKRLALTLRGVIDRSKDDAEGLQPKDFNTYQLLRENELVFKLIDLQNVSTSRVGLSHSTGLVSPAYIILRANEKIVPSYAEKFYLMMWHRKIFNVLGDNGVRSNLGVSDLLNVSISVPPICEQKRIADFLDSKCSEIDAISADIQKEIETLEQYKRSVITEAVTKGVNPNAETKKSAIFYMAPYNSEWRLTKIGYECTKLARPFSPTDMPLLCTNKGKVSPRPSNMTGKMVSEDNAMQGIHKGDIAIHGMDTWHGAIAMSEYDGKITRVVHVCDSRQDKRFIVYYLQQLAFNDVYKLISFGIRGNTSDFRSWDKVKDIYIALPDIDEQQKISDFLDLECRRVEDIVSEKKKQLDVLDAYKKSLIYEYVTGKKEVPSWKLNV